jgi:gluconokinase
MKVRQFGDIGHIRRRDRYGVGETAIHIRADVDFYAEACPERRRWVPLITLLGLVHLGVARLSLVLGRGRRVDEGGIRHGAALIEAEWIPWLNRLHDLVLELNQQQERYVLACSALTERYRRIPLVGLRDYHVMYLKTPPSVAVQRLKMRAAHFMPPTLVMSQFELLEERRGAIVIDGEWPAGKIVHYLLAMLLEKTFLHSDDVAGQD